MKRLILGLATILCLGLAVSIAQTINKSIQLSQDASGPIGFDTVNGVYFPAKINTAGSAPTLGSFGTSPGSDTAGEIIEGSNADTGGTLTFRTRYTGTPYCVVSSSAQATPVGAVPTPGGITITHASSTLSLKIEYICIGRSTG